MEHRDFSILSAENPQRISRILEHSEPIFPGLPRVGGVVGTFASVPYIHLHLEARRHFYPDTPLLVHDDGSHHREELGRLCDEYGCEFETNDSRQPPCIGDVSCFLGGLLWADRKGLDLLVKFSRRFVPLVDWVPDLRDLAYRSQYPTYCGHTTTFGFGFRSESVGLAVRTWMDYRLHEDLAALALAPGMPFVEGAIHDFARRLARFRCHAARAWDDEIGHRPPDRDGYAPWPFLGDDRCTPYPGYLWHDSASPHDYHRQSRIWGLPYELCDFQDPNQGAGNGT
jgi:hypothetical protein